MHTLAIALYIILTFISSISAKRIIITVGGNTTDDAGKVFEPQSVKADSGDVVFFNFTRGNHTATQSIFASPCIPAHSTDNTINGFDSSFRNAGNGTAITNLPVTITDPNTTIWFFDYNTCAQGGVGGININDSNLETLDGFERNAMRLNGTDSSSSNSSNSSYSVSPSGHATATSSGSATTHSSNDATHSIVLGAAAALPLIVLALTL
ncbi:hypothetical protein AX17_004602 [Amanita inopinata Kibby_2008]|nr:hypothetical protein AX17_004602 [Amanita inopinata Kibby_2008]